MKLRLFKGKDCGRKLVEPVEDSDKPLFQHCCDGMINVTKSYYEAKALPVLRAHGVQPFFAKETRGRNAKP